MRSGSPHNRTETNATPNRCESSPDEFAAFENRLRDLRPDPPPPDLRQRCLPPDNLCLDSKLQQRRKTMRNRILISSAGGLAAAAALALLALSLLPPFGGISSASAKMLQDARQAINAIEAVEVETF